jgi:hypothetical protein
LTVDDLEEKFQKHFQDWKEKEKDLEGAKR